MIIRNVDSDGLWVGRVRANAWNSSNPVLVPSRSCTGLRSGPTPSRTISSKDRSPSPAPHSKRRLNISCEQDRGSLTLGHSWLFGVELDGPWAVRQTTELRIPPAVLCRRARPAGAGADGFPPPLDHSARAASRLSAMRSRGALVLDGSICGQELVERQSESGSVLHNCWKSARRRHRITARGNDRRSHRPSSRIPQYLSSFDLSELRAPSLAVHRKHVRERLPMHGTRRSQSSTPPGRRSDRRAGGAMWRAAESLPRGSAAQGRPCISSRMRQTGMRLEGSTIGASTSAKPISSVRLQRCQVDRSVLLSGRSRAISLLPAQRSETTCNSATRMKGWRPHPCPPQSARSAHRHSSLPSGTTSRSGERISQSVLATEGTARVMPASRAADLHDPDRAEIWQHAGPRSATRRLVPNAAERGSDTTRPVQ